MAIEPEIMAKRRTYNNKSVQFWTDGSVTIGILNAYVKGAGVAHSNYELNKNVEAAWLLAGEVGLYDEEELPKAVKVARKAVRQESATPLTYFRQAMAGKRAVVSMNAMGSVAVVTFK